MKPLILKLTAFGPYKHTETINFDELKSNRLFVVSGNTGAGKTTIFDGICFALYGSASGEDRNDSKLLRSDFADDTVHTAAELEFELHDRQYRILRQIGHVKQGNKVATGERYEFFEKINGKEVPCVDRQIVSEINKKVEIIIGLTRDQFSQIVMLPQGEFRKLLTSETENKEDILRRIFKTEPYKYISEKLKTKKQLAEKSFQQELQQRDSYVKRVVATLPEREDSALFQVMEQAHYNINQVVAGLDEEVHYYEQQITANDTKYKDAYQKHDQNQTEYHKAKAVNERFQSLDEKKASYNKLNEQVPQFKQKEKQLEQAERANLVDAHEKHVKEWRDTVKVKEKALQDALETEKVAKNSEQKAEEQYQQQENQKSVRESINKKLDRYNDFLPTVRDLNDKKQALSSLLTKVKQLDDQRKNLEAQLREKREAKKHFNTQIKELESATNQITDKQKLLFDTREKYKVINDFNTITNDLNTLMNEQQQKQIILKKVQDSHYKIEQAWINGQASVLAEHLHDGEACPVCGSASHPNKATVSSEVPSKDKLEASKQELNKIENEFHTIAAKKETLTSQINNKQEELEAFQLDPKQAHNLVKDLLEAGKQLKKEVDELNNQRTQLTQLKTDYEKLENSIDQLDDHYQKTNQAYNENHAMYEKTKAVYQEKIDVIPEELRSLSELEQQIAQTKQLKLDMEKAWESAQKQLQHARDTYTKATSNSQHAKDQLQESVSKTEKAEQAFKQALTKSSFESEEVYQKAKLTENVRESLKTSIEQFNQSLTLVTNQITELKTELKDQKRIDLTEYKNEIEALRTAYESALNVLNQTKEYRKEALELKISIIEANQQVEEQEQLLNKIIDLYDAVRGQNSLKISFERYLQIEYLEQIILAANERLKQLSNGQFHLVRSDRIESRGKQSGLGLDVYDAYTGVTRDVKTLSGGEKFNTSLCLALGMADVIQSHQGGVSIETMFIDEGFGSLDEESLNKAIDTLIDLQQSGRMIGVISHVQELKAAIPAILQVEKTKEGYSTTKFVVQ
ncbi:AAA family ATPase [Radiobacillus sp. PE A8.2]|uniref:AAA family ATPase n=1 Tax=Radiobacillus sp. PE A8.2 TaxID=3380349 RepID=UPI00388D3156